MSTTAIKVAGSVVALGGVVWGLAWVVSPSSQGDNSQVEIWASGVFQLGLLAMLAVMWVTLATGPGRTARGILAAEVVAVVLAIAWTVPYLFDADRATTGILVVLDVFWPLSMLGVLVVGVLVARAGQWPNPVRYLPLAASLLIPVDLAVASAPDDIRNAVMGGYLAMAYGALGVGLIRSAGRLSQSRLTDQRILARG